MDRDEVIRRLRAHEAELKESGLLRLALFGSVARAQSSDRSDVDLVGDFDHSRGLTLFDLAGLEVRLTEILDTHVDLSDWRTLRPEIRSRAEREALLAF